MKKRQAKVKQALAQQAAGKRVAQRPVPSGQERMVTQAERDEVEALLRQGELRSTEAPAKRGES